MLKNNDKSFGSITKFFHWTIAPIMLIMLVLGVCMSGELIAIHKIIGLIVLFLATLRLIWVLQNPTPKLPLNMPVYEKLLAKIVKIILYICMFGMPLSGWAMSTAFGFVPHIGSLSLPMPGIPNNRALATTMENLHTILACALFGSITLHIAGALKHYFINKDNVLQRMLPFVKEKA